MCAGQDASWESITRVVNGREMKNSPAFTASRRTVRKGSAFPALLFELFLRLRLRMGGVASNHFRNSARQPYRTVRRRSRVTYSAALYAVELSSNPFPRPESLPPAEIVCATPAKIP